MYKKPSGYKNTNSSRMKPLYKPKKDLTVLQKRLMKAHKEHHTSKHLKMMKNLMLRGYCFQQAHSVAMKSVGK